MKEAVYKITGFLLVVINGRFRRIKATCAHLPAKIFVLIVYRRMDDRQQIGTDPCGSKVQLGPCAVIGAGPGLPPQLTVQKPAPVIPFPSLKPELNPKQVAVGKLTDQQSAQPKTGSTPAARVGISRPRPTALGTKAAPKVSRSSVDPCKERRSVPPCIPGPQSCAVPPHSPTESSCPPSSPHGLHSPQTPTSQPYLSPSATLSPPPSLSPQQQRSTSPESSAQVQSDKSGETNDFR